MKIGTKLTISHLGIAMIPLAILAGGMLFLFQEKFNELDHAANEGGVEVLLAQAEEALTESALTKLESIQDNKEESLKMVMAEVQTDARYLATIPQFKELYIDFKYYHDFGGVDKENGTIITDDMVYKSLYEDGAPFFKQFMGFKGYQDMFLVCAKHGHVLFSTSGHEDLGQNLSQGSLREAGLGRVWQKVIADQESHFEDYSAYAPVENQQMAFVGAPFYDETNSFSGVIILQIDTSKLDSIANSNVGLGRTGSTFVVGAGPDGQTTLRSNWAYKNLSSGTEKSGQFAQAAVNGEHGLGQKTRPDGVDILVAYTPVEISGLNWGLVTTQDFSEAVAAIEQMEEGAAVIEAGISDTRESAMSSIKAISGALILVFALLATGVAVLISRMITKPLVRVVGVADFVAKGDLSHRLDSTAKDEVGDLARAIDGMSAGLRAKVDVAREIAEGNLSMDVELASESDQFGQALVQMTDNLNEILSGVSISAAKVNDGAREISDSSTSLSDGATEQAASLEEITSSLTDLNDQVRLNAENATQADQMSVVSREAAEKGVRQMSTMSEAMTEISSSSEEIAKIIKVIDDIAFQTNLLALNAAVEAARAGKHGKGFAVVAEEVRNLAGRSAKAARETAALIEGSLEKVSNGTEISNQTSVSLAAIVEGVTKASDLVGEIAAASNEQAQGIAEVSEGLKQIDSVTQTNTANSEETASASQDLSAQASALQNLLSRFQLRGGEIGKVIPPSEDSWLPTVDEQSPAQPAASIEGQDSWVSAGQDKADEIIQLSGAGWPE